MRRSYILFSAIFALALGGCASVGNQALKSESETSVHAKITEGKSTKDEVKAIFGAPMKTSFTDGGLEIWNYEFTNVSADAISYVPIVNLFAHSASGTKKELVVMFNKSGVVERYAMNESAVSMKSGLAN